MANRETYPASMSPMVGDAVAGAGARRISVVGIQGIPVSSTSPSDQQLLRYDAATNQWVPSDDTNSAIYVNGVPVSDDYLVYVNAAPRITINGV